MKILITGSTGLLGQALCRQLAPSAEVVGLSRSAPPAGCIVRHIACDLLDPGRTREVIWDCASDVIIHTQAFSDVDGCELDPTAAHAQNVKALENVIRAIEAQSVLLVCMSSDYVFDGTRNSPYDETDKPNPISVYGRSKLEAERLALQYPRGVIVRTSTLFGPGRMNFCNHIVSRLRLCQAVEAFADQTTSPTYTVDLASGLSELVNILLVDKQIRNPRVYHLANAGGCTRMTFALRIAQLLEADRALVHGISMAQQKRPAQRPAYSALTSIHAPRIMGRSLPSWEDALHTYLRARNPFDFAQGGVQR